MIKSNVRPAPTIEQLHQQHQVITQIVSILKTDLTPKDTLTQIAEALQVHIPFQRFSMALPLWQQWYRVQYGKFMSQTRVGHIPNDENNTPGDWVILNQKPLLRKDITQDTRFNSDTIQIKAGVRAQLILPLFIDNHVMGAFGFASDVPNAFTPEHRELATSVADTIAVVIKKLHAQSEQNAIQEISAAVQQSLDLDHVLEMILDHICLQGYDRVRVYLYNKQEHALIGAVQVGDEQYQGFKGIALPIQDDYHSQKTFQSKSPQIYTSQSPETVLQDNMEQLLGEFKTGAWAEIPLFVTADNHDTIVGKISLDTAISKRPLEQEQLDRLMIYASQAAIAIHHAQLHQHMINQANSLTTEVQKQTEILNKKNRFQEALLHISQAVQKINTSADLDRLLKTCLTQFQHLKINTQTLALQRTNAQQNTLETRRIGIHGLLEQTHFNWTPEKIQQHIGHISKYKYVPNVKTQDVEAHHFIKKYFPRYTIASQVIIALPNGLLYVHSPQKDGFTASDIENMQEVAQIIALGLTRLQDIEIRENRTREIEAKNAELERFTYTVSHDLKSPLVTIQGFLGMLEKDARTNDTNRLEKDITFIRDATTNMDTLLNDLLNLSRIGRQVNESEEVNLNTLINQAVSLVSGRIKSNNIQMVIAPNLPTIFADKQRIRQVFQNLIDNATKFMGNQKNPTIEIGWENKGNQHLIFIRDNGIGIPRKYHKKIFGLFDRLNTQIEGTGVGLALVQRIVEYHQGEIWVESEGKNKGSTFYLTFPHYTVE